MYIKTIFQIGVSIHVINHKIYPIIVRYQNFPAKVYRKMPKTVEVKLHIVTRNLVARQCLSYPKKILRGFINNRKLLIPTPIRVNRLDIPEEIILWVANAGALRVRKQMCLQKQISLQHYLPYSLKYSFRLGSQWKPLG